VIGCHSFFNRDDCQGDQIGRLFAYWAIVNFGEFVGNCSCSPNYILATFFMVCCVLILEKNGWATFWAIFSKAHIVTLMTTNLGCVGLHSGNYADLAKIQFSVQIRNNNVFFFSKMGYI
jgi:hypothetical protein